MKWSTRWVHGWFAMVLVAAAVHEHRQHGAPQSSALPAPEDPEVCALTPTAQVELDRMWRAIPQFVPRHQAPSTREKVWVRNLPVLESWVDDPGFWFAKPSSRQPSSPSR